MRFLQIHGDGSFRLTRDLVGDYPPYAILSHRWGADEVTLDDFKNGTATGKDAYRKITFCGKQALSDNLHYFWVDTCCIDKSNSVELQEAINSMFKWYRDAAKCYVYLADVSVKRKAQEGALDLGAWQAAFRASDWFKRGWTLQELLAPSSVEFFSLEGRHLGDKKSLEHYIQEITHISQPALRGSPLTLFTQDERLSWARRRQTTKEEDKAYSLLGIFDVHMPLIYGEGEQNAFKRLQEEINKSPNASPQKQANVPKRVNTATVNPSGQQESSRPKDETMRMLLDSLRFEQMDSRQMTIQNAHAKTCMWFLNTSVYIDWLDHSKRWKHNGFLWIKGNPGTGKSTLMKFALATARRTMKSRVILGFFFNARGDVMEKSTLGAYQSLLLQLLEQVPRLQCVFESLGISITALIRRRRWEPESLKTLLEQAILMLGETSVICFVDALDECEEHSIRDMISFFKYIGERTLSEEVDFHVCFSSRHYPHITVEKGLDLILERQEGHNMDLTKYLDSELRIGHSELAEEIRAEVREKASGIFMWVVLVVRILNKEHDRGYVHVLRRRLKEIPADLHELFREILTRDTHNRAELLLCIQWVLFARQPLNAAQLYHAVLIGVQPGDVSPWDAEKISDDALKMFVLDSSKGLAEITVSKKKDQRVQFIHESVKDFLLKENGLAAVWPDLGANFEGQSHDRLKQCCLDYMATDGDIRLSRNRKLPKASSKYIEDLCEATTKWFPFMEYAVANVLYHTNEAAGAHVTQDDTIAKFPLQRWILLNNLFESFEVQRLRRRVGLLYIFAVKNCSHLIKIYPDIDEFLSVSRCRYGPPLFAAIARGNEEVLRAFVDLYASKHGLGAWFRKHSGDIRMDKGTRGRFTRGFKYSKDRNVFSHLCELGNEFLVKLLLKTGTVNVDSGMAGYRSPLSYAAANGHEAVTRLLLETNQVDRNSISSDGGTPLFWASKNGQEAVVRLLLKTEGVVVDLKGASGETPLSVAAESGHEGVVRLLLGTEDADINSQTIWGSTPLTKAAMNGHETVVKVLLNAERVHVDSRTKAGRTPLSVAASCGHDAVVKVFLEHGGVDVNAKDDLGRTSLSLAAEHGHDAVVKLLLTSENIDVNLRDHQGRTPLAWASQAMCGPFEGLGKYEPTIKLLLATGKVDPESQDNDGCTPLSHAVVYRSAAIVQMLLETGKVNVHSKDNNGKTPILKAKAAGRSNVTEMLLSHSENEDQKAHTLDTAHAYNKTMNVLGQRLSATSQSHTTSADTEVSELPSEALIGSSFSLPYAID